jgi:hypothetical protein
MLGARSTRPARSSILHRLAPLAITAALLLPAGAALAQQTQTKASCSPFTDRVRGDVAIMFSGGCTAGIAPADLEKIAGNVLAGNAIPRELLESFHAISRSFDVTDTALTAFFRVLGENKVAVEELDGKLSEIAGRHLTLLKQAEEAEAFAGDDPQVATLRKDAVAAITAGDYGRAETLLLQAFDADIAAVHGAEAVFNRRRLAAAKTQAAVAELKLTQLQYSDAAGAFREAADLVPPAEVLVRAQYLNRLGLTALDAAAFPLAERALSEALRIREGKLNAEHPDVAVSLNNLALLLKATDRPGEAEPLFKRAAAIRERGPGPDDANAKRVREYLEELRDKMAGSHGAGAPGVPEPQPADKSPH